MNHQRQDIGLLGGSFDPVHKGHLSIARSFINSGYISQLWILLTADPPHKRGIPQLPFETRLKMLKSVFDKEDQIRISTIEKDLPPPSYTVQTVQHLHRQYPKFRFRLCMGEDSVVNFHKWHQWEQILEVCYLLVAQRPSVQRPSLPEKIARHTTFISHEPVEISSTEIRQRLMKNKDVSHLLPEEVHEIVKEQKLYISKDG